MMAGIWGLLQALPELLSLFKTFAGWINKISGNDPQGFIKKVGEAFSQLNAAKTQEERVNAAKAISDAISGIH